MAACSCHGTPLDGSRRDGALVTEPGPARPARAGVASAQHCPISHLALDSRDIQQVGFVGHFSWPHSLAANATEIEAEVVVPVDEGNATQPAHPTLAVVSRVRLHDPTECCRRRVQVPRVAAAHGEHELRAVHKSCHIACAI